MKWTSSVPARTAILLTVSCLLALVATASAEEKTQLTGAWNFNPAQSDDAQQKVQQAQQTQQTDQRGPNSSGYPGGGGNPGAGYPPGSGYPGAGGYPGGGGLGRTGPGGGMGPGGMGVPSGAVSSQEWQELAKNPKFLNITQKVDQIVITDSESSRTFYPDGKKHKLMDGDGNKVTNKTEWHGDELVSENRWGTGKLTDTYEIRSDGKQLTVVSRYESPSLSQPLSIRRVYDLGNSGR
jgi:hypothetical protein